ncbi:pentapeptide repeat-containing protein [Microcoleus sp. FACHB-SPT15]|uniref:pentapeptide repeat-containing protein n=1 Tax=Microcoleus sp. FACHB-SPT15 TaxID=2692830 RepID=UPI00178688EF|nr:pentapeptide repeat-containing protein [Microcoleus sp. FACHB-SPT15]MBD1808863.1 pentapeptide repeat-containing protein [Microcoleus sp. FACHB-SPT15]
MPSRFYRGNWAGHNFEGADIRGVIFTEANLSNANFRGAKSGLHPIWQTSLLLISFTLNALLVTCFEIAGQLVANRLIPVDSQGIYPDDTLNNYIIATITFEIFIVFFVFSFYKGLEEAFKITSIVGVLTIGLIVFLALISAGIAILSLGDMIALINGSINGSVIGLGVGFLAFTIAIIICTVKIISGNRIKKLLTLFTFFIAIPVAIFLYQSKAHNLTIIIGWSFAWLGVILGKYIAKLALNRDKRYALVFNIAVFIACLGGTKFRGADLTEANFQEAILKCTDFRSTDKKITNITRTSWLHAKELDFALVGESYLQYPQVQKLLVENYGQEQNLDGLNLEGISLKGRNLVDTSFIGANLNHANLQDADLSGSKLKQTQLDGADFTGATLTGAYIEDWNITSDTKFYGISCKYVYMRLPTKEKPNPLRKPDNEDEVFEDGDFGDFIKPIIETLDLYHNQNVDPRAIAIAYEKLAEKNPEAELEIVAIEKRGEDKILLRVKTAINVNLSILSAKYFLYYNDIKKLIEPEFQQILIEKDSRIRDLHTTINTLLSTPKLEFITTIDNRSINTNGGNYNENIEGDYIQRDYSES